MLAITKFVADIKYGQVPMRQVHLYSVAKKVLKTGATSLKNNQGDKDGNYYFRWSSIKWTCITESH